MAFESIPPVVATICRHPLTGTGAPVDATTLLTAVREDAKEKEHKLCPSCKGFGKIAEDTTASYLQWKSDDVQRENDLFAARNRRSRRYTRSKAKATASYAVYMRMLSQYETAARWHQEHVDPALPLVNERGVALIPSLAYQNEPATRPRKTPKLRFEESYQDPTRETARRQVQYWRSKPAYQPGRYVDTSGEGFLDTSNPDLH